jgi:hypothetical protein
MADLGSQQPQRPSFTGSQWRLALFVLAATIMPVIVLWFTHPASIGSTGTADSASDAVAEFGCPAPGTIFVIAEPSGLLRSADWQRRVTIGERQGFDCRILTEGYSSIWLHAGLINNNRQLQWRAAAEELWPLQVGKKTRAHFPQNGATWSVEYEVAAYQPVTAPIGTYDAFKIIMRLEVDGKLFSNLTRWWSPALKYPLSYKIVRTDGQRAFNWEIKEIAELPR